MSATRLAQNDAALVEALAGNRRAFGEIVGRYQKLICSMAYSATGSLGQSEDLAQDTFVTAWKQLPQLREREKLRAWLCGIARFVIGKAVRQKRPGAESCGRVVGRAFREPSSDELAELHVNQPERASGINLGAHLCSPRDEIGRPIGPKKPPTGVEGMPRPPHSPAP